jgi:hypothetical protein
LAGFQPTLIGRFWVIPEEQLLSSTPNESDSKSLRSNNPRRNFNMPPNNSPTKADLQDLLDSVEEILDGAYVPEAPREDLVGAVSDALDALRGSEEEDEDGEVESNGD